MDGTRFIEVTIGSGRVRGRWNGAVAEFLGIPFAEPPVGSLRFAAPVPHGPWEGVRDELTLGATPQRGNDAQPTLIPEPSIPGESTLNVNVYTPAPGTGAALPVLVYIHGGGYFAGSPASPWYDGAAFARDGVVTVVISYRLGFEGFGWVEGAPHNRGVLDWILALEWVHRNIAEFGGDPGRVTIAGQSAGGGAVLTLLGMPQTHHLIHAVLCLSGATADVTPERAREFAARLAEVAGVEPDRAGFESVPEERLLELQKKAMEPSGTPLRVLRTLTANGLTLGPVVDGTLITRPTLDSIRAGVGTAIPLVAGTNDDEFTMVVSGATKVLRWIPARLVLGRVGLTGARRRRYLAANRDVVRSGTAAVLGRYLTDSTFRAAVVRLTAARGDAPTWVYRFAWRSPVHGLAFHCLDVPFFFDVLDRPDVAAVAGEAPPRSLATSYHAAAVALITSGAPGWPRYGAAGATRVFDTPITLVDDGYASVAPLV